MDGKEEGGERRQGGKKRGRGRGKEREVIRAA